MRGADRVIARDAAEARARDVEAQTPLMVLRARELADLAPEELARRMGAALRPRPVDRLAAVIDEALGATRNGRRP